jgi:hypothetical protein
MNQTLQITFPEKVFASLERTAKSVQQPLEQVAAPWLERIATSQDDRWMHWLGRSRAAAVIGQTSMMPIWMKPSN